MADFCSQCSVELFGTDHGDFAGIVTPEQEAHDLVALVLCEGCGPTKVDGKGRCKFHGAAGGTSKLCYEAGLREVACSK